MFRNPAFEILLRPDHEGSGVPDFYIRYTGKEPNSKARKFWVEAKYRGNIADDNSIDIFEKNKDRLKVLHAFQAIVHPETVFVVLGLGGSGTRPDRTYRIPVLDLHHSSPFEGKIRKWIFEPDFFSEYENGQLH